MKYLFSILIFIISVNEINSQIKFHSFIDVGTNNVSEGVFVKNAYRLNYQYQKYKIEAGIQFDLHSNNPKIISGIDIIASKEIFYKYFPINVKGVFVLNRFSDFFYETNWGLRVETKKLDLFIIEFGVNFKTYHVNSATLEYYDISKANSKLYENFNLTYTLTAYLMPYYNEWNVGLCITNVDFYTLNQLSNPVFNLQMKYSPLPKLSMNLDFWYKQAGMLNINANYFGYFVRGGIKWII